MKTRFRVEREVGAGPYAEAFLGWDEAFSRYVVIKKLSERGGAHLRAHARAAFAQTMRMQSRLSHPGVMPVLAIHESDDEAFVVMPVADNSLSELLRSGPVGEDDALRMAVSVCEAMEYVHAQGVDGGNLKPSNVFFLADGRWVVSDFMSSGDAHLSNADTGQHPGTIEAIAYSAPERHHSTRGVDQRSDVLSIGRILYHALTGRVPFPRVRQAGIPRRFRYMINKAISVDPSARYQTISEFRQELSLLVADTEQGEPLLEEGRALGIRCLEGDREAASLLVRLLAENAGNEILYSRLVPCLPVVVLSALQAGSAERFETVVTAYAGFCGHRMPLGYAESAVNFFRKVFFVAEDARLRDLSLRVMVAIGEISGLSLVEKLLKEINSVMAGREEYDLG